MGKDLIVQGGEKSGAIARRNTLPPIDIGELISKAVDSKSAVEVIKELRALAIDERERDAKAQFDEAMSAFQDECQPILKEKAVPDRSGKTAYKYAAIEMIEMQIRPLCRKYGFSHTFDMDTTAPDGWVIALCIVTHTAGHSRISKGKFPLGTKTAIMSDTQQFASALTFANRRALQNAYGLVIAGEDVDGATGKLKPQGPSSMQPTETGVKELAQQLWDVLKPVRGDQRNWNQANQWLWKFELLDAGVPETAPDLSPEKFKIVIAKAKAKLQQ